MTTIDSPRAMMMNAWHRSAKWPPSIVHSALVVRPSPGVQKPMLSASRSTPTAASQTSSRACPPTNAPAIQTQPLATAHSVTRVKMRSTRCPRPAIATNADRPTCIST